MGERIEWCSARAVCHGVTVQSAEEVNRELEPDIPVEAGHHVIGLDTGSAAMMVEGTRAELLYMLGAIRRRLLSVPEASASPPRDDAMGSPARLSASDRVSGGAL